MKKLLTVKSSTTKAVAVTTVPTYTANVFDGIEKCPSDSLILELPNDLASYLGATVQIPKFMDKLTVILI